MDVVRRFQATPPVNVGSIASELGLDVRYEHLPDHIAGSIVKSGDLYVVSVNENHHPFRQRFTLAHEIAHFILHRDVIGDGVTDNKMYRSQLSDHFETQANRLAADILMPSTPVRMIFLHAGGSVEKCAKQFLVSRAAMEIRLRGLGLLPLEPALGHPGATASVA